MVSLIHGSSGITLFSKIFDNFCEKIDDDSGSELIGSFLTALKMFSQEFGQEEIRQIEMSNLKFIIHEKNNVMIFFLLDAADEIANYKKSLIICLNAFLKLFSSKIEENYNNTLLFQGFNRILNEILKISPERIEPSCLNCTLGQKDNCIFKQVQEEIVLCMQHSFYS